MLLPDIHSLRAQFLDLFGSFTNNEPIETPVDEFMKAGGGAKCLTLRLDGEDAAGWRSSVSDSIE